MKILLLDPSILSENYGDEIIYDSVRTEVENLFPNAHFIRGYTQDFSGRILHEKIRASQLVIICGTNLLSSDLSIYRQWMIRWRTSHHFRNVVLCGVGWWQYQHKTAWRTSLLYRRCLSRSAIHSLRDQYSCDQLAHAKVTNTLNTACPTMWRLTADHCITIPTSKARDVVITLTDYMKEPHYDKLIIEKCLANYENVFYWPQGSGDLEYLRSLVATKLIIVNGGLAGFDRLLMENKSIEYVGTRLHAGIRALQHKKRSLIVAVDNRATEISKDTGLKVIERRIVADLCDYLHVNYPTKIYLPQDNIMKWKKSLSCSS